VHRRLVNPLFLLLACSPPEIGLDDSGWTEDTGDADTDTDTDTDTDAEIWEGFLEARRGYLEQLAEPILDCVVQVDTSHPAFHGCIDWHSAVHGSWALHRISGITGDDSYREVAESVLDPTSLEGELALLQSGSIATSEIPYGYAWFLALASEREAAGGDDLAPHAELVADDLLDHMWGLAEGALAYNLQDDDYQNLSWEALNLWQRAESQADEALAVELQDWVSAEIADRTHLCPLEQSPDNTSDFFPPCLHLAMVVLTVLPEEQAQDWMEQHLPAELQLQPLVDISSAHQGGLTFSRSWGLWALWKATGDSHYRSLYADHIETHMAMPQYWAEGYSSYSHWVAQFGVYGVALSYE